MKKLIIIALICSLATTANAQFSFGIKGGYNRNSVHTKESPYFPFNSNHGFHVGVYSQFPLIKKLSLSPEFQYIKKGPKDESKYYDLNYLELPILVNYQVWKSLSIEVGPTIGAPIFERKYKKGAPWLDMDFAEWSLDVGIAGGLRYGVTDKISLVARYNQSFLPFVDYGKVYLKNVQFGLMYKLK